MATAADNTHPTGMHSSFSLYISVAKLMRSIKLPPQTYRLKCVVIVIWLLQYLLLTLLISDNFFTCEILQVVTFEYVTKVKSSFVPLVLGTS